MCCWEMAQALPIVVWPDIIFKFFKHQYFLDALHQPLLFYWRIHETLKFTNTPPEQVLLKFDPKEKVKELLFLNQLAFSSH